MANKLWRLRMLSSLLQRYSKGRFKADSAHVLVEAAVAGIGIVAMGEFKAFTIG